jgi:D-arginine dehydrogenase
MPGPIRIIGGGVAGLATAWHLARRGAPAHAPVTVLEKEAGTGRHASGLNAGILRTAIAEPATRLFAEESAAFFRDPPAGFSDVPLVRPTGLVLFEPGCDEALAQREGSRALEPQEAAALLPHYATRARPAWYMADEGELDIAALMAAWERGARAGGVEVRTDAGVASITTTDSRAGVRVTGITLSDGTQMDAGTVVLAAGGWAGLLGRAAGSRLELTPRRRHLLVTQPDERVDPAWPVVWSEGDGFYARPESGGLLVSACDHTPVDPDHCVTDPAILEEIAAKVAAHLPRFTDIGVAHLWCAMRTFADDGNFRIGPDPDVDGLFWVAALGGHGMSTSAAVGHLAADWILTGQTRHPAAVPFSPTHARTCEA